METKRQAADDVLCHQRNHRVSIMAKQEQESQKRVELRLTLFADTFFSLLKTTFCFVDLLLRSVNLLLHIVFKLWAVNEECR